MAERLLPGGGYIQESGSAERLLPGDGYIQESAGGGGGTATGVTLAAASSLIAGSATGQAAGTAAGATLTATSSLIAGSASGTSTATITSQPLQRNTTVIAASSALTWVRVYETTNGDRVLTKTGLSTNGSGVFSFSDAGLTVGVNYELRWLEASGQQGFGFATAT